MDTLEINFTQDSTMNGPILWRNKTPQEVYREQYPDCTLQRQATAPKSLSNTAQHCDRYRVLKKGEIDGKTTQSTRAHLIPIPEKP